MNCVKVAMDRVGGNSWIMNRSSPFNVCNGLKLGCVAELGNVSHLSLSVIKEF